MSADPTSSSKTEMDCGIAAREALFEGYLTGHLNEEEREAFEEHYFACARCFAELQALEAIREELRRCEAEEAPRPARVFPAWAQAAALAATVVLALGTAWWMRAFEPPGVPNETAPRQQAGAESPSRPGPSESEGRAASAPSLEQLARVQAPPYQPLTLRGVPDEAAARFQRGMERYRKADYAGAITELRRAAALDPDASHIGFFLGICHLMVEEDDAGIARLRATIALGDSPYLEEAHLYLAKALLRRKDVRGAEAELKQVTQLRGSKSGEARNLLIAIQKLKRPSG